MFKRVPIKTKKEILDKVKNGISISEVSRQYAISTKTIYTWLSNQVRPEISVLEYNK